MLDGAAGSRLRRTLPELIWHYTSFEGARDIIESEEIWATHFGQLNDGKEIVHALSIIQDSIEARADHAVLARLPDAIRLRLGAQDFLGWHTTSFSEDGNLQNQWDSYADGGKGVALAFDGRRVGQWACDRGAYIAPVIYDLGIQRAAVENYVSTAAAFVREQPSQLGANQALSAVANEAVFLLPIMKEFSWVAEREWRLMVPLGRGHSFPVVPGPKPRIRFPLLVDGWRMPLRAVTLGPLSDEDPAKLSPRSWLERVKAMGVSITKSTLITTAPS